MPTTICMCASTLGYVEGGGHLWVYLNWILSLRSLGFDVIWLEPSDAGLDAAELARRVRVLREQLAAFGLADALAIITRPADLDRAASADLLVNFFYGLDARILRRFRRSAMIDIDPGLLQTWLALGQLEIAPHDAFFSIGRNVDAIAPPPGGQGNWLPTLPCVAMDYWPVHAAAGDAPFTTVSHWYADEWLAGANGAIYRNDKRSGFEPFLDLPRHTSQPIELALCLGDDPWEENFIRSRGWKLRDSTGASATPQDYRRYVQSSRGEFSCAKPAYSHLQNAWISDRTVCYLASGKPAIVQYTGPNPQLPAPPHRAGLWRFRTLAEAAECLGACAADYDRQCRLARSLAEELFDGRKVAKSVIERAMR
jgi:hypothetical protein